MKRSGELCVIGWLTVLVMLMVGGVDGRRVDVGGKQGWNQGINYTIWASQETFYIGDWLYFMFDRNYFDVLEVNETNYENCNSDDFVTNVSRGAGRDVYQLTEARPYYFICSKGYCYGGMKLAINVQNLAPALSPQENFAIGPPMAVMPVLVIAVSLFIALLA